MKIKILIVMATLGLVGCSPAQLEHKSLCKKDAGLRVYQKVKASGYFDSTCKTLSHCVGKLRNSGLEYLEFKHDGEKNNYGLTQGIYSIKFNDTSCDITAKGLREKSLEKKLDDCLYIKKEKKVSAKYELVSDYIKGYKVINSGWSVTKDSFNVIDRASGKVIAEDTNFVLFNIGNRDSVFFKRSYSCPEAKTKNEQSYLINKALYK